MVQQLTIADFLQRGLQVHQDDIALIDEPDVQGSLDVLTYGQLAQRVCGMMRTLDALGIPVGARVGIFAPNCSKFHIALFAVAGSGRVLVPINFRLGAAEVDYIVGDAGIELLLVDPEYAVELQGVDTVCRIVLDGIDDYELFAAVEGEIPWARIDENDTATINYTSGTTSLPKGVMLSHRAHWLNAVTLGWHLGVDERDVYLHTLPQFHVNGWGLPLATASRGITNVILRSVDGAEVLRRVERYGVTLLCGAAPVVASISEAAEKWCQSGEVVPGAGRTRLVSGGAATPATFIEQFESSTGWELIHAYGMTECAPVLTVNRVARGFSDDVSVRAEKLTHAGPALTGVRLELSASDEVLVRAGKAFSGYWNRDDLTNEVVSDGWIHTGDGGALRDGILTITDRQKDVIVSGGENVASLEIEACLLRHEAVSEVAVIAIPHPRWGETPKAYVVVDRDVVIDPAALGAELIAFTRVHLAHFKCPTAVELVDGLPYTSTGKVQKFLLRRRETSDIRK